MLNTIKNDQMVARKNKNQIEANLLTTLIAEMVMVGKNQNRDTSNEECLAVLQKFIKNINEFEKVIDKNNPEFVKVQTEKSILSRYLPSQLSNDEIKEIVIKAIDNGINKDMGSIMKHMKTNYNGQYDGKQLSTLVKELL